MLGGRQRFVVLVGFSLGLGFGALGARMRPSLPSAGSLSETGPAPVDPIESGEVGAVGPLYQQVARVAASYDLDPALVMAVIDVESGSDPHALSAKGAIGLMQVLPSTAADVGLPEAADPAHNLEAGCRYLAALLDSFGGDVELSLAAYNAGPGAVRHWGNVPPYRETRRFVERVRAAYRRYGGADLVVSERIAGDGWRTD